MAFWHSLMHFRRGKPTIKLIRHWSFPSAPSQLEPNELGLTLIRAVQWPIPGILKAPVPAEELDRGVRAGTRSKRSPTPFRNWRANADRGWEGDGGSGWDEWHDTVDNSLTVSPTHTHIHTPPCVCFWPTVQLRRGVRPTGPGSVPGASTRGSCVSSVSPALWPTGPACCGSFRQLKDTLGCFLLLISAFGCFSNVLPDFTVCLNSEIQQSLHA